MNKKLPSKNQSILQKIEGFPIGIMTQVLLYDISVVLDGNSLKWQITVQALRMKENEVYAGSS